MIFSSAALFFCKLPKFSSLFLDNFLVTTNTNKAMKYQIVGAIHESPADDR